MKLSLKKNNLSSIIISVSFFLIFINIPLSIAGIFYVSPSGGSSWNNATDISTPCSPSTALANAIAGDIVYFRGGTYDPGDAPDWDQAAWNPANSGTPGNPITFKAYPEETPVVLDNTVGPAFGAYYRDWIVWDGFKGPGKVAWTQYAYFFESDYCVIQNCDIAGYINPSYQNNSCIGANSSNHLTIRNNILHDTSSTAAENGAGILFFFCHDALIENNEFYNNSSGIFDKDWGTRNIYRYNFFHDNKVGWSLGAQTGHDSNDIQVYQNVFIRNSKAIRILGTHNHNTVKLYNNVMYNNGEWGMLRESESLISDFQIYNNITHTSPYALRLDSSDTLTEINYNNYYNTNSWRIESSNYNFDNYKNNIGSNHETNSNVLQPLFVNAGGALPEDYKLSSNSPLIGKGKGGVDMGAYPQGDDSHIIGIIPLGEEVDPPTAPLAPVDFK